MVTAVFVPPTGPPSKLELEGKLAEYQTLVGGYIQAIDVEDVTFIVNEEGRIYGMSINPWATAYLYTLDPTWEGHDHLVGPVVLVGHDEVGELSDVPAQVLEDFLLPR